MTRITSLEAPSCTDKIYSNVAHKITNIHTIPNINSEHNYISAIYTVKEPL